MRKLGKIVAELGEQTTGTSETGDDQPTVTGTIDFGGEVINEYLESPRGKGTLRTEFPHGKSVTAAYWDPRGRQIVSTCYDNTLRRELASYTIFAPNADLICSVEFGCKYIGR